MSTTVTGTTYKHTRPRGCAPWNPRAEAQGVVNAINDVLDEYRNHWPLTNRQIYYRLVASGIGAKTEPFATQLGEYSVRGRRAGMIPWAAIRDDGTTILRTYNEPSPWTPEDAIALLRLRPMMWTRDRQADQPVRVEVWTEAAGMAPQIHAAVRHYSVSVVTSGGFNSVTAKYDAATRILRESRPTVILQIGDHDPSGCAVIDSAADDIRQFVIGRGGEFDPVFRRVAVTPAQIDEYDLPTTPSKSTDNRGDFNGGTVQAEALPPDLLNQIVSDAVLAELDVDVLDDVLAQQADDRARYTAWIDELGVDQ